MRAIEESRFLKKHKIFPNDPFPFMVRRWCQITEKTTAHLYASTVTPLIKYDTNIFIDIVFKLNTQLLTCSKRKVCLFQGCANINHLSSCSLLDLYRSHVGKSTGSDRRGHWKRCTRSRRLCRWHHRTFIPNHHNVYNYSIYCTTVERNKKCQKNPNDLPPLNTVCLRARSH